MQIRLYANLRDVAGTSVVDVNAQSALSVRELLDKVFQEHPDLQPEILDETGELKPFVNVFIDGRGIRWMKGLETTLEPDAEVAIFPPVAGGC